MKLCVGSGREDRGVPVLITPQPAPTPAGLPLNAPKTAVPENSMEPGYHHVLWHPITL